MTQITAIELAGVYASAQSMFERENRRVTGQSWSRHSLARDQFAAVMLAKVVAGECVAMVHDGLTDIALCDPIETAIEQRFGLDDDDTPSAYPGDPE